MLTIDKQGCDKLLCFVLEVEKQPIVFLKEKFFMKLACLMQGFVIGYNNGYVLAIGDILE